MDANQSTTDARQEQADLYCPECGYNLRGIDSTRCPECGTPIDRAAWLRARLPWPHRRQLGRIRAYWRTLVLATFHPTHIARDMTAPASYADARRFWLLTVALLFLPAATLTIIAQMYDGIEALAEWMMPTTSWLVAPDYTYADAVIPWTAGMDLLAVPVLAVLLCLLATTGAAGYLFHLTALPRLQQNRAIILSYYTCAPAAWLVLAIAAPPAAWWLGQALDILPRVTPPLGILLLYGMGTAVAVIPWWHATWRVWQRVAFAGAVRTALIAAALPLLWLLMAFLTLGALPWTIGLFRLIVLSIGR